MARKLAFACLLGGFFVILSSSQTSARPAGNQTKSGGQEAAVPPQGHAADQDDDLPEEDESVKPRVYPFNPLEAERNIKVGAFYMHQGTPSGYRAAVGRFEDATKYNPTSAEGFLRLGEAEEKLKHPAKAKAAFERAIKVAPDSKPAREAKKKLASLG